MRGCDSWLQGVTQHDDHIACSFPKGIQVCVGEDLAFNPELEVSISAKDKVVQRSPEVFKSLHLLEKVVGLRAT